MASPASGRRVSFQRSTVDKLPYSPNYLTLPLRWKPGIAWRDLKNTPPTQWPAEAQRVLQRGKGGIYIFHDATGDVCLYVGRTTDFHSRFKNYQNETVRGRQRGVAQIDLYEKQHPNCEINVYVA